MQTRRRLQTQSVDLSAMYIALNLLSDTNQQDSRFKKVY